MMEAQSRFQERPSFGNLRTPGNQISRPTKPIYQRRVLFTAGPAKKEKRPSRSKQPVSRYAASNRLQANLPCTLRQNTEGNRLDMAHIVVKVNGKGAVYGTGIKQCFGMRRLNINSPIWLKQSRRFLK